MADFLAGLPKAELHLHIEGTLEPQFLLERAHKHQIQLKYQSLEEVQKAYQFSNLQSFLDIYYLGMEVLRDASDFTTWPGLIFKRPHPRESCMRKYFWTPRPT